MAQSPPKSSPPFIVSSLWDAWKQSSGSRLYHREEREEEEPVYKTTVRDHLLYARQNNRE